MSAGPQVQRVPTGDAEVTELEGELELGQQRIVGAIGVAFALQRDAGLRARIAAQTAEPRFALSLEDRGPYLVLDHGKLARAALAGEPPPGLAILDLRETVEARGEPATLAVFSRAYRRAHADAERTVAAMTEDADRFSRDRFTRLARWAPLVAADAYRQAALLQAIFDLERPRVVADPRPGALRTYWARVHLVGHLTVLATAGAPTTWLADMANAFTWQRWTPSFPLVRERIARLAVRGAWAACRFGTSTVDRYLANLDAPHLLRVFDAVLALVALAAASDADRAPIAHALVARLERREHAATTSSERATLATMLRTARLALDSRTAIARGALADAAAHVVDSDRDAAEIDARGRFPTILAMATLATAPAAALFPLPDPTPPPRWDPARARAALGRTVERAAPRPREWN